MSVEQEILALESKRFAAMCTDDFGTLDKLVHAELVYTHSNAVVDGKASWIESMRSGKVRYRAVAPSDQKVRVYGDTAFITAGATVEAQVGGQQRTMRLRYTSGWTRTAQGWQFVAWQATLIPA